ncbi:MAG: polyprenol monophosphomannose synthase [Candidatus Omnitrophica bacterium]|nr:polyprenol monophosphomannose synthase [Candidatus Omnitrophota bacterium]
MTGIIVIPTYNESKNIALLIKTIFSLTDGLSIIAVDDNSPDGTGEILDSLAKEIPRLKVIHRHKKMGLGSAYTEGFKLALQEKSNFVFQMDGDFSHDPKYILQMLKAIKDYDLVIGSRYVPGGGVENWNFWRRILSKFGNLYVRLITGIPVRDTTSGFKCFRREVLESINLERISSEGYAFQIEMNYLVWQKGFRIKEIPIIFYERRREKSKINGRIILEALRIVWKLRYQYFTSNRRNIPDSSFVL